MRRVLTLVCLCLLGIACSAQYSGKVPPKVINGEIDLTGWDFEKDGPVKLNGDWLFAWEKFVEPGNWEELNREMVHRVSLPAIWTNLRNPRQPLENLPALGYASYALKITGLKLPAFDLLTEDLREAGRKIILDTTGHILFVADEGTPAQSLSEEREVYNYDFPFTYKSIIHKRDPENRAFNFIMLIHHSNFSFYNGRVGSPIMSYAGHLVKNQSAAENQKAIMIGILLIVGIFHLILFFQFHTDRSILFFSLICFSAALRQFLGGVAQSQGLINFDIAGHKISFHLGYTAIVSVSLCLAYYLRYLLPSYLFWRFCQFLLIPALFLQCFIFFVDGVTLSKNLDYYLIFVIIALSASFIHLVDRTIKKDSGAGWVLFSFAIISAGALNDILNAKDIINTASIATFTVISFILMQAFLISKRIAEAQNQSEVLAYKLDRQYKEKKELLQSNEELAQQKLKYSKMIGELSFEFAQAGEQLEAAKLEQQKVTEELTEASNQLIQAEKLSGLGAMVSGIAHDINNPLNFIETARFQEQEKLDQLKEHLLDLVPEGEEGEEFKEDLLFRFEKLIKLNDQIKKGVTRVSEISKSMRNASRSDTKKTPETNLVEIIEESVIITSNKVKQFELIKKTPDGIALATCNRSQIGQVVMNFLSNAADALVEFKGDHKDHKGVIKIDLSISNQKEKQINQKIIKISVSDNGAGVPAENRDKILNAFFTTKEAGSGTGLGLAIAGKIAQAHEGTIHIEDGLDNGHGGHGARFTLEFAE